MDTKAMQNAVTTNVPTGAVRSLPIEGQIYRDTQELELVTVFCIANNMQTTDFMVIYMRQGESMKMAMTAQAFMGGRFQRFKLPEE